MSKWVRGTRDGISSIVIIFKDFNWVTFQVILDLLQLEKFQLIHILPNIDILRRHFPFNTAYSLSPRMVDGFLSLDRESIWIRAQHKRGIEISFPGDFNL